MSKSLDQFDCLQPQEIILGLFGEYVAPDQLAWSGGLVSLLEDLGFSAPAARLSLNRVIARGLLSPGREGRLVFYSMTKQLDLILQEGRRRTFPESSEPDWTGQWTLVWYSIPEARRLHRGRFGRWLSLGGFGSLQDGTWIAPGDNRVRIYEILKRLEIEQYVSVVVGELGLEREIPHLSRHAWKIGDLTTLFDRFLAEAAPYLETSKLNGLDDKEKYVIRTNLIEKFRKLMVMDPRVPDELLGVDWCRKEAIDAFLAVQTALREPALRHFRKHAIGKNRGAVTTAV